MNLLTNARAKLVLRCYSIHTDSMQVTYSQTSMLADDAWRCMSCPSFVVIDHDAMAPVPDDCPRPVLTNNTCSFILAPLVCCIVNDAGVNSVLCCTPFRYEYI